MRPLRVFSHRFTGRVVAFALGVAAISLAFTLVVGSAAARTAPTGTFSVKPGYTIHFTGMNLDSGDSATVLYCVGGYGDCEDLGTNSGIEGTDVAIPDGWYTNTGSSAVNVYLVLMDNTSPSYAYVSNGASVIGSTVGTVDHATLGYAKGKIQVSINDASQYANETWNPTLGAGAFNATVKVDRKQPTLTCTGLSEGFDDISTLVPGGWYMQNTSDNEHMTDWFQGKTNTELLGDWGVDWSIAFDAQAGAANSYIAADYNNTYTATSLGTPVTISNWLVTPPLTLVNGATFTFYWNGYTIEYPERLQVWLNPTDSTNVGTTSVETDTGAFTTKLLDLNPDYGTDYPVFSWEYHTITLSGLTSPTTGRIAFRYYVEDAGNYGANSDYIGIDTVNYTCP